MRRVAPDQFRLEKGERFPLTCGCGWAYVPEEDSEYSTCPLCGEENVHADYTFTFIPDEPAVTKKSYQPNLFWRWFYNKVWRTAECVAWYYRTTGRRGIARLYVSVAFGIRDIGERRDVNPLNFLAELKSSRIYNR